MAQAVAWINSITNATGTHVLTAAPWEALTTDTLTNNLMVTTNEVIKNVWDLNRFKWDTSVVLHYDVVPDSPASFNGAPAGGYALADVFGSPSGTGNVTLDVYLNDTLAYERTVTSPVYTLPATLLWGGTNVQTNTLTTDATVSLDGLTGNFPLIKIGGGVKCLVRATRATTATTGIIGASIE